MIAIGTLRDADFHPAHARAGVDRGESAEDYVEGARAIGLPNFWIILRYILPNVLPPILVQATLTVATAIIAEASLSFLGLRSTAAQSFLGVDAQIG